MFFGLIPLLLGCLSLANGGPVSNSRCSESCQSHSDKFKYEEGHSYIYSYSSRNKLILEKASDMVVALNATVSIGVVSKCELVLKLSDVILHHGPERANSHLTLELEKHVLPFAWADGKIHHVCPNPEDSDEVNNIKKAILSIFQNSMRSFQYEAFGSDTDILGTCDTEYKSEELDFEKYEITRTKNIPTCSNYLKGKTLFMATFYPSAAHRQHLPILTNDTAICKEKINAGILEEATCTETSFFKPLSTYALFVQTKGMSHIKFVRKESLLPAEKIYTVTSTSKENLVLKHVEHSEKKADAESRARDILKHGFCDHSKGSHKHFSNMHELVYTIREMSNEAVENIYTSIKNKEICDSVKRMETIYIDALKSASSGGAINLLVKLVESGEVSLLDSILWQTMLPFTAYVEEESIEALLPLLKRNTDSRQALLGATALAYKYCAGKSNCDSVKSIKLMSSTLKQLLGDKCHTENKKEIAEVLTVLKALGNLGHFGETATMLLDCAKTPENEISIRVAAIEAFRRSPCHEETAIHLLNIYMNKVEVDELRIAALISLTKCATRGVAVKIAETYESETSTQVQVFTYSYIGNLKSTSDPTKSRIKSYFVDITLEEPDKSDILKYSKSFQTSSFSDIFNLGDELSANVIHSSASFLPRSANMGYKLNILGNHLEMLEVGGRVEGLEHILEKVFGPTGIFSGIELNDVLQLVRNQLQRTKRSTDLYQNKIDALTERIAYTKKDPHGTAFIRIMGHELGLLHLYEDSIKRAAGIKVKELFSNLATLRDIDVSKNLAFFDVAAIFPSITGIPYKLAGNGSLSTALIADGLVDLKHGVLDIDGKFKPSILAEISASLTILTKDFEPGIRAENVFKAELDYNAKAKVKDGIVHIKIKRQNKKSEIMSSSRKIYILNHAGKIEMAKPDSYNLHYCSKYIQHILGAKYCFHMSLPHFYQDGKFGIPFVRAHESSLSVEETDPSMLDGYEFYLKLPQWKSAGKNFKFLVDTPKSNQDRKVSIDIDINHAETDGARSGSLAANFYSRFYSLDFKASLSDSQNRLHMTAEAIGNRRRYSIDVDAEKDVKGARLVHYKPMIKVNLHSMQPMEFTGNVTFSNGRKQLWTFNLESPSFDSPFTLRGSLAKDGEKIDLNSNWKLSYELNANVCAKIHKLKGAVGHTEKGVSINLSHHYEPDGRSYESVTFYANIENITFDHLGFMIDSKLLLAEHDLNAMLKLDFSYKPFHHFKTDLVFGYGEHFDTKVKMLIASEFHGDFNNFVNMRVANKIGLTISCLDFDKSAMMVTEWNFAKPKLVFEVGVKTGKQKELSLEFHYEHLETKPHKLSTVCVLEFTFNSYKFKYSDQANEVAPGEYNWKAIIHPMKGKEISTNFLYKIKRMDESNKKLSHQIDGTVNFPEFTLKQKGSFEYFPGEIFNFYSFSDFGLGKHYTIDLHFEYAGRSELKLQTPFITGDLIYDSSEHIQTMAADFKSTSGGGRSMVLNGKIVPGDDLKFLEIEVKLDTDKTEKVIKIELTSKREASSDLVISGLINYAGSINVDISGKISNKFFRGPHSFRAALSGKDAAEPMAIEIEHKIHDGHLNFEIKYLRSGIEKIKLHTEGKYIRRGFQHLDIKLGSYLHSPYKTFDGKVILFRLLGGSNEGTRSFLAEYCIKLSPALGYEGKMDYIRHKGYPGHIKSGFHVTVRNQSIYLGSANVEYRNGNYSIDASFTPVSNKKNHLLLSLEHASRFAAFHHSLKTHLKYLEKISINTVADFRSLEYSRLESNFDLNDHKFYVLQCILKVRSLLDFDGDAELVSKYFPSLKIVSKSEPSGQTIKFNFEIDVNSKSIISGNGELKKRKRGFNGDITFTHHHHNENKFLVLTLHQDGKGKHERNYAVKLDFPNISRFYTFNLKTNLKKDKDGLNLYGTKFCRNEDLCIEIDVSHKEYGNGNEYIVTYKRDDVEFSIERIRETNDGIQRFHTVFFKGDQRYGYDLEVGRKGVEDVLGLGIILPSRELSTKAFVEFSLSKPRIKLEMNLDARNHPDRKLKTDMRIENHLFDNNPSKLELSIEHPVFEKPLELEVSADYKPDHSSKFFIGKVSFDYSKDLEDKIIGTLDIETFSLDRGEAVLQLYHKDENHLDFVVKVNRTSNKEDKSFGIFYTWKNENNADQEAHIIASYHANEKFLFEYVRPKVSYRLDGVILPSNSVFNDTREIRLDSIYNGQRTRGLLLLEWRDGCIKLYIFDDENPEEKREFSRITELCVDYRSRAIVSLVSESFSDDEALWTADVLLDVFQRSINTIGIKFQANPEFVGKYLFTLTSLIDELEANGIGTLPFHDSHRFKKIRHTFNSKVFSPASNFFMPEGKHLLEDIKKDSLSLKHAIYDYYKNLPSVDFEQVVNCIKSTGHKFYSYFQDEISYYVDKIINYGVEKCNDIYIGDGCKILVQSFKKEGFRGVLKELSDWILSLPSIIEHAFESFDVDTLFHGRLMNQIKAALQPLREYRCGKLFIKAFDLTYEKLEKFFREKRDLMNNMVNYFKDIKKTILTNELVIKYRDVLKEKVFELIDVITDKKWLTLARKYLEEFWMNLSPSSIEKPYKVNSFDLEKSVIDINLSSNVANRVLTKLQNAAVILGRKTYSIARGSSSLLQTIVIGIKKAIDLNFIPEEASAMIIDHKHIVTFDDVFYDFSGECAYLLARDFDDGNFTLVLKHKSDEPASLVVLRAGTTVELKGSVQVDGNDVELPYISKSVTVSRGGNSIKVDTKNGLEVECHLVHKICTVSMSGWYFGKTAGLFGTYNFEMHDEFRRPKGQLANSINAFAKSYELKKGCKTSNLVSEVEIDKKSDYYKDCLSLFGSDTSPMVACFTEVDPYDYLKLCARLSAMKPANLREEAYCTVATAYLKQCEKNYVDLNLPPKCLTCVSPNNTKLEHGDREQFQVNTKSSDILFLVEDHECNTALLSDLGALARSMEKELSNEGFRDNMFGLVGFSGEIGETAKIFTSKDKILFLAKDIGSVVERFKLQNKKYGSNAFDAMKLAITELFRSHTVKSLVLLSCSPCKYDETSINYPIIQEILLQRGIILHVIRDTEIRTRGKAASEIIGFDPKTVFHSKDVAQRDLVGDPSLRSHVSIPKDVCVALSQDVNGSFFSTHSLKSSSGQGKNWRNVFSRKILKSSLGLLSSCQSCDCTARDHVPNMICQPCETKKPRLPFSVGPYSRTVDAFISYIMHVLGE